MQRHGTRDVLNEGDEGSVESGPSGLRAFFSSLFVKTTPQKTRFRSVNLYKEFAYKSRIE